MLVAPFRRLVVCRLRSVLRAIFLSAALLALTGCADQGSYPNRPITLVCPWGAGGGTDRVSRQIAAHLEADLGTPINVINAIGGKGVTGHSQGLRAKPDGYTLTMATIELNMMHWSGLTSLTTEDCLPLVSVNEDHAALFVRRDAPWQTLSELEEDIRRRPGQLKASGTSTGGIWHLALAGWLDTLQLDAEAVNWISSTGAGPSLQQLMSGGFDIVCCSLPEAKTLHDSGEVRALGVMAPRRIPGFEEVPTFAEQGTDWSLGGWRAVVVPRDTPAHVVEVLTTALKRIVQGQTKVAGTTFPQFMHQSGFNDTWRSDADLQQFLRETDRKIGALLTSEAMRSVNTDRFNPMAFPTALMVLLGITLLLLGAMRLWKPPSAEASSEPMPRPTWRGRMSFVLVVTAIAAYLLLAETVGFILLAGLLLGGLFYWLGNSLLTSALGAAILSPAIYQLFAHVLHVPLPRGWLG